MCKFNYLLLFIALTICSNIYAQPSLLTFKHLTIDDGLSQNSINCIHQDKNGFMWFGTHDGLNRYDGYSFNHFRNERNNTNSISNNYIYAIHEDEGGILWIATFGGGLNRLDPLTGKITRIKMITDDPHPFPGTSLFSIIEYPTGTLWIGSGEGLIRLDKKSGKAKIFLDKKKDDEIFEYNYIGTIGHDETGNLWLQTDSGLTRFDVKSTTARHYKRSPFSNSFEMGVVFDIEETPEGLLVACGAGLVEINLAQKTDSLVLSAKSLQAGQQVPVFQRILSLGHHRYSIGTNLGLLIYDAAKKDISFYQNDAVDDKSLSHNSVLSLYKSNDGIIWVGTRNGLNIIETESPNFVHIRSIPGENRLSSKNVSSFMDENDSLMWIGTTDGLNLYNTNNNTCEVFRMNEEATHSLASDYILCLYKDSKGNKWAGMRGGGFCKIENTPGQGFEFLQIKPKNDTSSSVVTVHFITEGTDGLLWIGTGGAGLWRYNVNDNTVFKYTTEKNGTGLSHPYVFTILEGEGTNLWLGTPSGGLNLLDRQTGKFIYFQNDPENGNSISNNIILSLYKDNQNDLWVGTNAGLCRFIPKTDSEIFYEMTAAGSNGHDSLFINFGQAQGFPNSVIYGMLEDEHRNLWVSTNKGIVVFNMDLGRAVNTFDVSDGLQSNEFNQNAFYKSTSGKFYFGGVNGVSVFHPDSVDKNPFVPPVVITEFSIFNEPVKVGHYSTDKKFFLSKAIHSLEKIDLSWEHNIISFEFAALSYISPDKNKFSYMLEGFNKDWVEAGTKRTATYTHLDPGNYVFRVQASNNSGVWNEKGTALKIHISSPPWLSWYAYIIYLLSFLGMVYLFVRYRINKATQEIRFQNQIEKAKEQEREEFRKKSAADFHDEAGNKITKITLFAELARTEINNREQLEKYLKKIQSNISGLSSGMRDFLWVMDPLHDNLFETISRLKDFGDSMLSDIGVQFTISGMNVGLWAIALPMNTRRDILQIFKEAIHNCAKYAVAGKVTLSIKIVGPDIEISLCDNGIGFDTSTEKTKNKYGLTIMQERAQKIGAALTIHSQKNKGTTISLKYNMPHTGNSF